MNSFLQYIKENKLTRVSSMLETTLREKTLAVITEEKMRVAASLLNEDAPKALKTINSHAGYYRHLADVDPTPVGYTARHTDVPSPYASSPTDVVHKWNGKNVFHRETSHKHYQVFEVPKTSKIHQNENDASDEHISNLKKAGKL